MTKPHHHAVVWIDHREAKVFHFNAAEVEKLVLHPDNPSQQVHRKANSIGAGHAAADEDFLHEVAQAIADAGAVLITGPGVAKTELVKHIHRHDPKLMDIVAAVETVDHPSDGELLAHARKYFAAADRTTPQR